MPKSKIFFILSLFSFLTLAQPLQAAAPSPTTDETAYVTLDYYGQVEKVSVVKAVNLNSNTQITDYGNYTKVQNLSTLDQPQINGEQLIWQLSDDVPRRFYYEVTPENKSLPLPWTFDLDYQLNGVPVKAEDLAGASGLVSIDVKAVPNLTVDPYYSDNFVLVAGMIVDWDEVDSFAAPGSQFHALGSYQAALFMATPRDERTFHFEIGTDDFKNPGVVMMMVPATLEQLEAIGEIKEHKSNLEAAGNATDAIIDDILSMMGAMTGGMTTTISGLNKLDEARATISGTDRNLGDIQNSMASLEQKLRDFSSSTDNVNTTAGLENVAPELIHMTGTMSAIPATAQSAAVATDKIADQAGGTLGETATLLKDSRALISTIDNTLANSGNNLDEGTRLTLQGTSQMLREIVAILSKTNDLQKNKNTISAIIRDEWSRFDDELGMLDIDVNAKKLSFTSDKNPAPRSVQIVVRSQEIDTDADKPDQPLEQINNETILDRVRAVFKKIGTVLRFK
ncbi:MAG: hypothetical protein Q4G02_01750 [bacterium]|nr:hypothetical protein [bacterium]